jgi:hypothetical protein
VHIDRLEAAKLHAMSDGPRIHGDPIGGDQDQSLQALRDADSFFAKLACAVAMCTLTSLSHLLLASP